jgi:hypothetical protein
MIFDILDRIIRWFKERQGISFVRGGERAPSLPITPSKPKRVERPTIMNTLVTDVLCYEGEPCRVSWDVETFGSWCVGYFTATLEIESRLLTQTFPMKCEDYEDFCRCTGLATFTLQLSQGIYNARACSYIEGSQDCDYIMIFVRELPEARGAPPPTPRTPPTRPLPY